MEMNELRARALEGFRQAVHGTGQHQWDETTPCTDWTVRDLVNHITSELWWSTQLARGRTMDEVGDRFDGELLGDNPRAEVDRAIDASVEAFRGDHIADVDTSQGPMAAEHYLNQMFTDALVHTWDLAVATGQDTSLDPELCAVAHERAAATRSEIDGARQAGLFGPEVPVAEDASHQAKLLALLGRDPTTA